MKCLLTKLCFFFLIVPTLAFAGWQVAQPTGTGASNGSYFQAATQRDSHFVPGNEARRTNDTVMLRKRHAAIYAISVSGSLKENIERIMERYHWKVKWKAPYDYNFDGRITGTSLPNVIQKLLSPFPLQAILYMSNRTMIVVPRNT